MATIVVTGGAGFIGSSFIKYLYQHTKHDIICVDKMTYAADKARIDNRIWGSGRFKFIEEDICCLKGEDLPEFEYLVNFAAESHVDNSIEDGSPFSHSNVEGVRNLLDLVRNKKMKKFKRFVQISTDEVYGDFAGKGRGALETDILKPSSYYSASKAAADMFVIAAHRTYGIPYLITRSCNNFGNNQHAEKFIPTVVNSIRKGCKVPIYGDGKQSREWIHVDDNVRLIYTLMVTNGDEDIVNIGSGYHYNNLEVLDAIGKALKVKPKVKNVADRLGHDVAYDLDCSHLRDRIGNGFVFLCLEAFLGEWLANNG